MDLDADLDKLLAEVEEMPAEKLEALAKEIAAKQAVDKERRQKYNKNKSPEAVAKQRERMKTRNKLIRERNKAILAKAKELGITV